MENNATNGPVKTSVEPWLSVYHGNNAIDFYKSAFNAVETYRMDVPDGSVVAKLSIDGAEFWISGGTETARPARTDAGDIPVRMILTVADPDAVFAQAVAAGASIIFPVGEDYGWRLGRIEDPFGHHWEIGKLL